MDRLRVALLYNLRHPAIADPDAPIDLLADQDTPETVHSVTQALREAGHEVIALEADHSLLDTIRQVNPDICFNMARGREGQDRSSYVPALLELLHIPYTGSGVMSHALAQDKATAKRIWEDRGLPTANFQEMHHAEEPLSTSLREFPLFVKPLNGSASTGIGIGEDAIVWNETQLRQRVAWIVDNYLQPALIEQYLPGREFSVAILGNAQSRGEPGARSRDDPSGYHLLPVLERIGMPTGECVEVRAEAKSEEQLAETPYTYVCPAHIPELAETLQVLSAAACEAVYAVDLARVDFRCDTDGMPHLLEIDTLPSMEQDHSRYIKMATAGGMPFIELINTILGLAVRRYQLDISPPMPLDSKGQEVLYVGQQSCDATVKCDGESGFHAAS